MHMNCLFLVAGVMHAALSFSVLMLTAFNSLTMYLRSENQRPETDIRDV